MVLAHSVEYGWRLEHLDAKSALLLAKYRFGKPVYLREISRADQTYKHGKTIWVLKLNLYGNPSGIYYYMEGLLEYLKKIQEQFNEAESCLIRVEMKSGLVIAAIVIDHFLVTEHTPTAMDEFYETLKIVMISKDYGDLRDSSVGTATTQMAVL